MSAATDHANKASGFVANGERMHWHDKALWFVREKRDRASRTLKEWEALRERAAGIKAHTLSKLSHYLQEFEKNAQANGAKVHWAEDAEEHNRIVESILKQHQVAKVVKSKSMLTEECGLNHHLEDRGIEVVDTDLGERIVQLAKEPPSHIVLPAIHKKKEEIGELFHEHMNSQKGETDPGVLTETARQNLRQNFMKAGAGISGVNFAIAESGGIVICTNEGNADLGVSLPKVHIACMGIEKIVPRNRDLSVFLRLLARSATGQPITTYSSHFFGPRDENSELHIVIVDNGRSLQAGDKDFRRSLSCIRCGACMNTCPVYRRSGGHSYSYVTPGPIGSILAPLRDSSKHNSLPFACSLCGSCSDVCPVKIDLHSELLKMRGRMNAEERIPIPKTFSMKVAAWIFASATRYELLGRFGRFVLKLLPKSILNHPLNTWAKQREMPEVPEQSFREMYRQQK